MAESRVIDAYLVELRFSLDDLPDADDILAEAADHLYSTFGGLVALGASVAEAESQALARFGSASLVASEFEEEAKRGGAVSTTLTKRTGIAAMATSPLLVMGAMGNELVPASRGPVHGLFLVALAAGVAAFAAGLWGLRRRHGGLGKLGRLAFWWFVASPLLALPAGYGALLALAIEWLLIMSLLGVGMLRARVLPAPAVALATVSPLLALAVTGGATLVGIDAGEFSMILLLPVGVGFTWLGWAMAHEPALDVRPSDQPGPLATA
jgi:hypothetical protein